LDGARAAQSDVLGLVDAAHRAAADDRSHAVLAEQAVGEVVDLREAVGERGATFIAVGDGLAERGPPAGGGYRSNDEGTAGLAGERTVFGQRVPFWNRLVAERTAIDQSHHA